MLLGISGRNNDQSLTLSSGTYTDKTGYAYLLKNEPI